MGYLILAFCAVFLGANYLQMANGNTITGARDVAERKSYIKSAIASFVILAISLFRMGIEY